MNLFKQKMKRIKNNPQITLPRDFRFNPFSYLLQGFQAEQDG